MLPERYFDHAATTPLDPRVLAEMMPWLTDGFGNPNSLHAWGTRAAQAVDIARERVATLIGAEDPSQIVFTSGASEANNWVAQGLSHESEKFVSPFEHSSMRVPAAFYGWEVLAHDGLTLQDPGPSGVVSCMTVNNEVGAIFPSDRMVARFRHADITQQAGKLPCSVSDFDFASLSAHKFYGPKGVGVLFVRDLPPDPLIDGGGQEMGRRSGTLNVPGIVGMGAAAEIAGQETASDAAHAQDLRAIVLAGLTDVADWQVNGGPSVSPYIISLSFQAVQGETLVIELDRAGFAISAGAACSAGSTEPSPVLAAMNIPESWATGTVRISFGRANTLASAADLAQILKHSVEKLRNIG